MVRAGKPIKYDVNVKGEPAPTITWIQGKDEVKSEGNVEIINVEYNTKLNINSSLRKNTGVWKILAVNQHGQDEAEVEITVLCKLHTIQHIKWIIIAFICYSGTI